MYNYSSLLNFKISINSTLTIESSLNEYTTFEHHGFKNFRFKSLEAKNIIA